MFTGLVHLHSSMRYLIILAAIWTLIQLGSGWIRKRRFRPADKRPGLFFLILMDLQLLVGLIVYFFNPHGWGWSSIRAYGMSGVMRETATRFFAIEHAVAMIIALILVHVAYSITKKTNQSDKTRFGKAFCLFLIAFLFILSFIPWPFREALGVGSWV